MNLYVGTSGYSYKEWKGSFYPDKLPAGEMLRFYAEHFTTVEINNTFYRLPKADVLEGWASQVPDSFRFVLKASRRITHFKRLNDAEDETEYLIRTASLLGDRLGVVLFQLPPDLKKDLDRLTAFLAGLPKGVRAAFEFRHATWFDDAVYDALRARGCALCIADAEGDLTVPLVSTADWGYVRLRQPEYTEKTLAAWWEKIRSQGWTDTYVFFKHEDSGTGPRLAKQFIDLAREHG
jgi:uncharacterized protein YecE (DUF72 family)